MNYMELRGSGLILIVCVLDAESCQKLGKIEKNMI